MALGTRSTDAPDPLDDEGGATGFWNDSTARYVAGGAVFAIGELIWPVELFPVTITSWRFTAALILTTLCFGGFAWLVDWRPRQKLPLHTNDTPQRLARSGPYTYLRHPMYTAWVLGCFGIGFVTGRLWCFAGTLVCYVLLWRLVVLHEEPFLARKFGRLWRRYAARTCRGI